MPKFSFDTDDHNSIDQLMRDVLDHINKISDRPPNKKFIDQALGLADDLEMEPSAVMTAATELLGFMAASLVKPDHEDELLEKFTIGIRKYYDYYSNTAATKSFRKSAVERYKRASGIQINHTEIHADTIEEAFEKLKEHILSKEANKPASSGAGRKDDTLSNRERASREAKRTTQ